MTARAKIPSVKAPLVIALTVLAMLVATGPVGAFYAPAGAKPTGAPGGYMNPNDGMCIVGVAADGTMLVDWSITNARDCVAYTTGLTGMTPIDVTAQNVCGAAVPPTGACNTQPLCTRPNGSVAWNAAASKCFDVSSCVSAGASNASCTAAGAPLRCCTGLGTGTCGVSNDGYKHTFATTNTCVNAADPTTAISLVDLDRTAAMCFSKGGTTLSRPRQVRGLRLGVQEQEERRHAPDAPGFGDRPVHDRRRAVDRWPGLLRYVDENDERNLHLRRDLSVQAQQRRFGPGGDGPPA